MPLYAPTRKPLPNPVAAQYFYPISESGAGTSNTLGNGTLRLAPWVVETTLRIDRLGAEVLATVGEAGSKLRIGIYADNGNAYPGTLVLDAGQIDGTSATVQEITVSLTLTPGLYWLGGAVQSAPTTQPNVRTLSGWVPPAVMGVGTSLPGAGGNLVGYSQASVTAGLPGTFTATVGTVGSAPRLIARAA